MPREGLGPNSAGSCLRHHGNKPVFQDYSFQLFNIGRAACIHDRCHLLEVIPTDERGSNDGQRLRIRLLQVVETMNCATRDKTGFPRANIHRLSFLGGRHHALNAVDGLVVLLVIMGQRHLRSNWDREFKQRHRSARVGSFEQESDAYLPDADDFALHFSSW